jgi:hypothetical protein
VPIEAKQVNLCLCRFQAVHQLQQRDRASAIQYHHSVRAGFGSKKLQLYFKWNILYIFIYMYYDFILKQEPVAETMAF